MILAKLEEPHIDVVGLPKGRAHYPTDAIGRWSREAIQLCSKLDARSTPLPRLAVGLRILTEPHKVPDALASSSIDQHNNVGCRRPGRDQPGLNTRVPLLAKVAAAINHLNTIEAGKTITQGALAVATRSFA